MADSDSWVARTSADIRLHRDFDAGDHPGARVFYGWNLVDEVFRRAKGCRHLTVEKSRLHQQPSIAGIHASRTLHAKPPPIRAGGCARVALEELAEVGDILVADSVTDLLHGAMVALQ